jgi:hypothetical protein
MRTVIHVEDWHSRRKEFRRRKRLELITSSLRAWFRTLKFPARIGAVVVLLIGTGAYIVASLEEFLSLDPFWMGVNLAAGILCLLFACILLSGWYRNPDQPAQNEASGDDTQPPPFAA